MSFNVNNNPESVVGLAEVFYNPEWLGSLLYPSIFLTSCSVRDPLISDYGLLMYFPLIKIQHLIGMINQKNSNVVQKKLLVTKPGTVQYKIYFKIDHFLLDKRIMEVNIFYTITNNYNFGFFLK